MINSLAPGGDFNRALWTADILERNGYRTQVLAWNRSSSGLKTDRLKYKNTHFYFFKPVEIRKAGLALSYIRWWLHVVLLLSRLNYDLLVVQDLYSFLPAFPISLIKRKPIVYDLIDFVADSFAWRNHVRFLLAGLEQICVTLSKGLIVVDSRKQLLTSGASGKMVVVTNTPPDYRRDFDSILRKETEFTIYYGGLLKRERGLGEICEAIKEMKDIRFVIAGTGNEEQLLHQLYGQQHNVKFVGLLSAKESLEWTFRSHMIPIFYDPIIPIHRRASPAKLYDAMMCGTPVLVNCEAVPVAETVKRENCGLIVPYGSILGIRSAIRRLKEDVELRTKLGTNARKAYDSRYNPKKMESNLLRIVCEILQIK